MGYFYCESLEQAKPKAERIAQSEGVTVYVMLGTKRDLLMERGLKFPPEWKAHLGDRLWHVSWDEPDETRRSKWKPKGKIKYYWEAEKVDYDNPLAEVNAEIMEDIFIERGNFAASEYGGWFYDD